MFGVKNVHLACKGDIIVRSNYMAMYGPLMDQGTALTLCRSALFCLESLFAKLS